jgi:iron complex outermembrane receptor protein
MSRRRNRLRPHPLPVAIALAGAVSTAPLWAGDLPEVSVEEAQWPLSVSHAAKGTDVDAADSAEALKTLPGAAANRNGGLTALVQYRGLSGDRINLSIDGASVVTGGPNAMDSPLSYIPASLLQKLAVNRGPASVSKGQETYGGHIEAGSSRGEFGEGSDLELNARLHTNYTSHNEGSHSSLQVTGANQNHKLGISTSFDHADNSEFGDGDLNATAYERRRHDVFYGYARGDTQANFRVGKNNTAEAGTPALPMDISAIDSDLASFNVSARLGDLKLHWSSSYSHVFHAMDNFGQRPQPMMGPRETLASGQQTAHRLQLSLPLENGELRFGLDRSESRHDADVYNPLMAMFRIENFNDTERNIDGLFAEWQQQSGHWSWELGARINRVEMDAAEVSAFMGMGQMGMMNMTMMTNMAGMLATAFNGADRSETYNNRDLVFKLGYRIDPQLSLNASLSSKQRAPSYQERYLWLPMQATGGLADGHTYIGNLDLNSETADEINLGIDLRTDSGYASLQVFYRDVEDYIQGTPYAASGNMMIDNAVGMFANMMGGGNPPLQYNNVDAELYGGEFSYGVNISDQWSVSGQLSYVRGKRADVSDDLYRIAPLNHRLSLNYHQDQWRVQLINELYGEQDKVSTYNSEAETGGYGLVHLRLRYDVNESLQLRAGVDNLADKSYQNHLAGYNRVMGNEDVAVGERMYGTGRSVNLGLTYHW